MSGDQSSTAGSSTISSENIATDANPPITIVPVPATELGTNGQTNKVVSTGELKELNKSLQEYGGTLAEIAVATSDSKYKDELTAIESWFQVLSRAERTASIYSLLQHSDQDQKKFFIALLQQLVKTESESISNESTEDSQLKAKPFARGLRPPSLNLPSLGSPSTPRFTPATSRGGLFAGPAGTVNTPSLLTTNKPEQDGDGTNAPGAVLNVPGIGALTPQALNMVASSGLSTEAQLLAIQLVMNGLVQPANAQIYGGPKSAKKHGPWRPPASAKYPGSALRHSALRSGGLKSAGLRSAVPDSAMEGGVTPKEEDFDPEVLTDIPGWLRSLRLHKYTSCFDGMTWKEMVVLDDETLEKKGIVTVGARRRLMRTFEVVRKKMEMTTDEVAETESGNGERRGAAGSKLSAESPVFVPRELRA